MSTPPPQSLMFTFLGDYLYDSGACVFSGSVIDVLSRLGVNEHATRSTLARMVNRGLLRRQRHGRRMYFGLTPRTVEILQDGEQRIWKTGAVNHDWDGTWTLLGFSLPESWQRQRHDLRSQLVWAGFGPLQGGLWIAPGPVTVDAIVAGLGLAAHVRVFRATADQLTDIPQLVDDAYDLDRLATGYRAFLDRWAAPAPGPFPQDPLAAHLSIVTEWLRLIRRDPRLPVAHLPDDWPAVPAQQTFHRIEADLERPARTLATALLDTVPDETA
ncbi:MAG TPA: PaaX family transcriptional regulator C-terminal domain-containing protein [Actinophytocola sp.]|uniref:PaaX family transcriptional regulator n=1 Tax=Actinophytocola sp. TaxID=1872138 RepID=UPI002DBA5BDE|nr:PaaX family transcriptional regulator C-terminal domain-containing protein [Actinophytocola sp.]HEU5475522.1 PaaX family transcriptional regulator C-terminal domain-containing protein [Actinophytocola sp.]